MEKLLMTMISKQTRAAKRWIEVQLNIVTKIHAAVDDDKR